MVSKLRWFIRPMGLMNADLVCHYFSHVSRLAKCIDASWRHALQVVFETDEIVVSSLFSGHPLARSSRRRHPVQLKHPNPKG